MQKKKQKNNKEEKNAVREGNPQAAFFHIRDQIEIWYFSIQ